MDEVLVMRPSRTLLAVGLLAATPAAFAQDLATPVKAPAIDAPIKMQVGVVRDGRIVAAPTDRIVEPDAAPVKPDAASIETVASIEPRPAPVPSSVPPVAAVPDPTPKKSFEQMRAEAPDLKVGEVCSIIRVAAEEHRLPKPFLARLIWKESRFDTKAVSPVGALGIAQFMPGTAKLEGLANPFDPRAAIHASAKHLADMRIEFGNLGLAAIGYNAGRERARKFLGGNDWLPDETENYVAAILGRPAEDYAEGDTYNVAPLKKGLTFPEACRKLPVIRTRAPAGGLVAARSARNMPWHIQVSRHFARHVAVGMYKKVKRRHAFIRNLPHAVVVERARAGLRDQKAVMVGATSRAEAQKICTRLKRSGGFCIVKRNKRG